MFPARQRVLDKAGDAAHPHLDEDPHALGVQPLDELAEPDRLQQMAHRQLPDPVLVVGVGRDRRRRPHRHRRRADRDAGHVGPDLRQERGEKRRVETGAERQDPAQHALAAQPLQGGLDAALLPTDDRLMRAVVVRDHDVRKVRDGGCGHVRTAPERAEGHPRHLQGVRLERGDEPVHILVVDHPGGDHGVPLADAVAADEVREDLQPAQRRVEYTAHFDAGDTVLPERLAPAARSSGGRAEVSGGKVPWAGEREVRADVVHPGVEVVLQAAEQERCPVRRGGGAEQR